MTVHHVYGEPIDDLAQALVQCETGEEPDGLIRFSLELEPDEFAPLLRALMRAEADLLREDAERLRPPFGEERTEGQRRADALVELVRQLGEAFRARRADDQAPRVVNR